ncbi:putative secondary metabolism biosynthetic enzyme [Aspergillus tanneri]|uniref:Putative secondary metabolism biosynthetic enzyme n=1 Tax=Aspergillus tanneri TaxID=1220188 RepID=A0A5M9MU72_9EURO|nr:putative secondary metabolism biosynthetic enzyme [Aspergillus tanneri]KAA8649496.1 putative secondary metabolism biosynthetic enzyme [Aspergillus tanneri]
MERHHESKQVGRRLLLNYIDAVAAENPTMVAITQVVSFEPNPVHFNITYQDMSNLINRLAWWLDETYPKRKTKDITIAYLGSSDARHLVLTLAAVKAGYRLMLLSPRNSVQIHDHLIKETKCQAIIFDSLFSSTVTELTILRSINAVQAPELVNLLSNTSPAREYPYLDTFQDASDKPLVIFHTSGSTGMPKPVAFVHAAMAATDSLRLFYSEESYRVSCHRLLESAHSVYNGCPLFHLAGFVAGFFWLFSGGIIVIGPANQPSSPQMLKDILHVAHVDGALLPPLVVDQIAQEPALIEKVSKLRFITFGGGSVSQEAGNLLSQKTRLISVLGSSECGLIGAFMIEPENWNWFHFAEKEMGIRWHPIDEGTREGKGDPEYYELVIHRDDNLPQKQAVFVNFPHLEEWHTKDIFQRHPSIPYYWRYESRIDDVIVFSTGEKMNPITFERELNTLQGVHASLVVGHKRPYPILLIELEPSANVEDTLPAIHQALEDLNKQSMKYAQIHRNDILIATPEKPFARMAKGTISRSQTAKLYATEIEAEYTLKDAEQDLQFQLDLSTDETLMESIAEIVRSLTSVKDLSIHDDFFARGLDSRQVQMLAQLLARVLPDQKDVLFIRNAVYMNPTTYRLPTKVKQKQTDQSKAHHILLTGSTGFIGSFILRSLMHRQDVTEITCIDRRIPEVARAGGAVPVHRFKGDLAQPYLGLSEEDYSHLLATVTVVIHCQWPVTFNLPLALFESHIAGVANLIRLAYDSNQDTRLIFLSSIATIQGWDQSTPVPESPLDSLKYAQGGYGQSKLLASKLLQQAGLTSGVTSAICRVAQVGGPVYAEGVWPPRDWFPTLLRASEIMGCLPASLGSFNDVDWLPVDCLSEALVELALGAGMVDSTGDRALTAYYHFTNPSVSSYTDLVPTIARRLGPDCKVVSSLEEWNKKLASWSLQEAPNGDSSVESSMAAAMALLEFYVGLEAKPDQPSVRLDTTLTVARIPSLQAAGAVNESWIKTWLDQWGFGTSASVDTIP